MTPTVAFAAPSAASLREPEVWPGCALVAGLACAAGLLGVGTGVGGAWAAEPLLLEVVRPAGAAPTLVLDGTVEAQQDARVAAQVSGRISAVLVKAGDAVQAGQPLVRIDAAVVAQQAQASQAQVAQADALLRAAQQELARTQALQAQGFISPATLDRARAQFQSAQASAQAMRAQAQASGTQAGFQVVKAPYAGRVSQVLVSEGDLAAPGVPLLQVFAPRTLRVVVSVPESLAARLNLQAPAQLSLPHVAATQSWAAPQMAMLPGLDPLSHAATLRVELPADAARVAAGLGPGQLARVSLTLQPEASPTAAASLSVPQGAVVQRGEVPAVYVVDAQGVPRLRQVRLGRSQGGRVDVVAGLQAGERVATDPLAAARRVP